MRYLREKSRLRNKGFPLPQKGQPHLEAQRQKSQGHSRRQSDSYLRLHQMPPLRQSRKSVNKKISSRGCLFYIAGLCKGSTTDSDSVCEGSNPSPAAKKYTVLMGGIFFAISEGFEPRIAAAAKPTRRRNGPGDRFEFAQGSEATAIKSFSTSEQRSLCFGALNVFI